MARSAALLPPTTDRHPVRCCHRHVETIPGSRRSAVAGELDFCLASGLLRSPFRLRGPRCFSTYTLSDCVWMSIGPRKQFSKRRKLLFGHVYGGLLGRVPNRYWRRLSVKPPRARAVQAAVSTTDRPRHGAFREVGWLDPANKPNCATPAFSSDSAWADS